MTVRDARLAAPAGALLASVLVLALIPVAPRVSLLPTLTHGLLVAVLVLGATPLAAAALTAGDRHVPAVLDALLMLAGCGLAMLAAAASVAAMTESLQVDSVVLAQQYTGWYLLKQPAAAAVFLASASLGGHRGVLGEALGAPGPARTAAALALDVAAAALAATLFAAGFSGPGLPGVLLLVIKTVVALGLILGLRRAFERLGTGSRLTIAWGGTLAGIANLVLTFFLALRQ